MNEIVLNRKMSICCMVWLSCLLFYFHITLPNSSYTKLKSIFIWIIIISSTMYIQNKQQFVCFKMNLRIGLVSEK